MSWHHDTLDEAESFVVMDPASAQPWCNFVLWTPMHESLPDDCKVEVGTLSRECPPVAPMADLEDRLPRDGNGLASYRFEIAGDGRRLRIKEFLYDWAFPALDHPSLWKCDTWATPLDDHSVVWMGVDFRGKRAASARLARTTIELSVLEGEFSDDEIVAFYKGFFPIDDVVLRQIIDTPFADLSYWSRYENAARVVVPVGLWEFRRREHESSWCSGDEAMQKVAACNLPASLGGLAVDSMGIFRDLNGNGEIEVVYAGGVARGAELRLIAQRPGGGNLVVPAPPSAHAFGTREVIDVENQSVQLAWIDERYGPYQAVFPVSGGGWEGTLLSTSGVGLDRAWFLHALHSVMSSVE